MLCGHAICLLGIEYAVRTWYMSSGDGICCGDMLYAFWGWNMLYGHGIYYIIRRPLGPPGCGATSYKSLRFLQQVLRSFKSLSSSMNLSILSLQSKLIDLSVLRSFGLSSLIDLLNASSLQVFKFKASKPRATVS